MADKLIGGLFAKARNSRRRRYEASGSLSRRLDRHGQFVVRRWPKAQRRGEQPRAVGHRLRPPCASGERRRRNLELPGQPLDKRLDRLLNVRQGDSGVAKQGELIGIPPTCRHEFLVGTRQGEASRHAVRIKRNAEVLSTFAPDVATRCGRRSGSMQSGGGLTHSG